MIRFFELYIVYYMPFVIRHWYFRKYQKWGTNIEKDIKILSDPKRFQLRLDSATPEDKYDFLCALLNAPEPEIKILH